MEDFCPRCRTSSYQNPNMKLLVNVCGHKMCESCVDAVFTRPSATCPECGIILRRNQYRLQQFEDSYVEKEVEIRKKVLKDYNKNEEDFPSLREYNDYLEELETIIFNLANGIDVEITKQKIDEYKKNNQALIMKNRQKQLRQEQLLHNKLHLEKTEQEMRNRRAQEDEIKVIRSRKRQQESLLNELISSDRPAEELVAEARATKKSKYDEEEETVESTGVVFSKTQFQQQKGKVAFEPLLIETGSLYTYKPLLIDTHGPGVPDLEELKSYGYLENVRSLESHNQGGGFLPAHACHRALQEAFSCLTMSLQDR